MFTSSRTQSLFDFFIVHMPDGSGTEFDEIKVEGYEIIDGILYVHLCENRKSIYKVWSAIDYKYNKPN